MKPLFALLLTSAFAWAQTPAALPTSLSSDAAVAAQVDSAQRSVQMVVSSLWSQPVSEALRRAAQNRGVEVHIIVEARYAEAPDAYTTWHALHGTAAVRVGAPRGSYLLIDDALLVDGPFVGGGTRPFDARDTYVVRDPALVAERRRAFTEAWANTTPLVSFIESLSFEGGQP